ncbi:Glycosyltransferase family 2 [Lasiodiplodia theobromae]|uniref:Glycosyltransferase family 2 n=1 Tax=Lasiodiplodia theobromae TaxID=45133 RepID=UPI0015C3A275|nr:Glycosyltransferase family 2 [Lasiodiplodia theobromae]KAF4536544.1 Glycosyltransferase family 2 [Lasiodiplodia theobromae]
MVENNEPSSPPVAVPFIVNPVSALNIDFAPAFQSSSDPVIDDESSPSSIAVPLTDDPTPAIIIAHKPSSVSPASTSVIEDDITYHPQAFSPLDFYPDFFFALFFAFFFDFFLDFFLGPQLNSLDSLLGSLFDILSDSFFVSFGAAYKQPIIGANR